MKVRSGFVSNSSSSSFVFVGWEFDRDYKSREEWIEVLYSIDICNVLATKHYGKTWSELDEDEKSDLWYELRDHSEYTVLDHEEQGAPRGKVLVGKMLTRGNDCDPMEGSWFLSELVAQFSGLLSGLPFDSNQIKIVTGTMLS